MPEILKKSLKTGDRFVTIVDFPNDKENVLFQTGDGQLSSEGGNCNGRVTGVCHLTSEVTPGIYKFLQKRYSKFTGH